MNTRDPKLVALQFNECINARDIEGLAALMTEDHIFVDREGKSVQSRGAMLQGWNEFFRMFPKYRNTFTRIRSGEDGVAILGHAYWSEDKPYDPVIWTAVVADDRIREWRVHEDTELNRRQFGLT